MPIVAIATCAGYDVGDDDQPLLIDALAHLGIEGEPAVWTDPSVEWDRFDLVVLRSTWDYTKDRDAFLRWVSSLPRVENDATTVGWNTDKRYLADLEGAGIPVVPTRYVTTPGELDLPGEGPFVLKPTVGAGAMGAERFDAAGDDARAHAKRLLAEGRTVMVQPYLEGVEERHETAVIMIDGMPTHAIAKGPMLHVAEVDRSGLYRRELISDRQATSDEIDLANGAIAAASEIVGRQSPPLYARVDLLPGSDAPAIDEHRR